MIWLSNSVPRRWTAVALAALVVATSTAAVAVPSAASADTCRIVGAMYHPLTGDWDGDGIDTIGVYDPRSSVWFLRNSNSAGAADLCFRYGTSNDIPVVGDWDGDGTDTVGVVRRSAPGAELLWHLRNSNTGGAGQLNFGFGYFGSQWPVVGDWDGDGDTNIGVVEYTATHLRWHLRHFNSAGPDSRDFKYGVVRGDGPHDANGRRVPSDRPVVGDWDGNGTDTVGVIQSLDAVNLDWHLRNTNTGGGSELEFRYGALDTPVAGDWDGDGTDGPGLVYLTHSQVVPTELALQWALRNRLSAGRPNLRFEYGVERFP